MRNFRKASLVALLGVSAAFFACGDDDALVRTRPDGGATDASTDAPLGEGGGPDTLSCGVSIPTTYVSPNFATNAKAELDFKAGVIGIGAKMKTAEGAAPVVVTTAELNAIFTAGVPSLRSVATAFAQATVDTYLMQFGDAVGKTWVPADADTEAGAPAGGRYDNASIVSATGVDLRETTEKILINGSLYNYALLVAGGVITEATIDRLLALYGVTPALLSGPEAGADANELVAEYASKRDNKVPGTTGPYRKIGRALRAAKAAAATGEKCRADLDAALKIYFLEWEKVSYLTVIYYLNQAATNATAVPAKGQLALHGYGEALGFAQSFKGIPQDRRKITDVQIDALLTRIGATAPYKLVIPALTSDRVVAFNGAYSDIGAVYGLTPTEIEDAKKEY